MCVPPSRQVKRLQGLQQVFSFVPVCSGLRLSHLCSLGACCFTWPRGFVDPEVGTLQLGWAQCSYRSFWEGTRGSEPETGHIMVEAEVGVTYLEDEGGLHEPKNADGPWKLAKARKWILQSLQEEHSPDSRLDLRTSNLQDAR